MTSIDCVKVLQMTQDGLINKILKTSDREYFKSIPITTDMVAPLRTDSLGKEYKLYYECKYASVIGILVYGASNSRPDISFVVHQCARFTQNFKLSHENSILRIFK